MRLSDPIKIAYRNIMGAKWRSFLTVLGIIIGVASVILIMAIGQSAQALIIDQVSGIGSNLIGVLPGASDEKGPPAAVMGIVVKTFKYDDLLAIRNPKRVPEVESATGYVRGTTEVSFGNSSYNVPFTGTTASYLEVENTKILNGRFFTEDEETNLSRLVVLGSQIAEDLFNGDDPLDKKIKVNDQTYMIVGVLEERGSTGFGSSSQDDTIFLPLRTAQKLIMGIDHLGYARVKAKNPELVFSAIENIKLTLRERHKIKDSSDDDFSVRDQASAIEMIKSITDVLRYFLLAVGAMSLLVGGVGIMNIMLIAVNQRIREVGLRKAVGAHNHNILFQFLIESVVVALTGGIVGIAVGIFLAFVASVVIQFFGYNWPFIVSFPSIVVAVLVSMAIGIIFGLYPARKASRISPMEALRYE